MSGTPTTGAIEGHVWLDITRDGVWDAGEPGLAGAMVNLYHDGGLVNGHTTLGDGYYSFAGLAPGEYTLIEIDPAGYGSSTTNHAQVNVAAGQIIVVNFGDYLLDTPTPTRTPTTTATPTPTLPTRQLLPLVIKR